MPPAPHPADEPDRLQALRRHMRIDEGRDDGLQAIAEMAARAIGVPIALVSLVDDTEQFFGGCTGLEGTERTPRDAAFCAYTILEPGILEVPDARQDSRFADNPLVTGWPYIRFYAGVPLTSADGHRLGTLCLIDQQPRQLDARQRQQLHDMAETATRVLRKLGALKAANAQLSDALEEARRAERATTMFFTSITHELRTPLNAVIGFAQLLEQQPFGVMPDDRYVEYASDIRRSGEHLLALINDILDVSRLEAGQLALSPEEVNLGAEVDWALRLLEPLCQTHGATVQPADGLSGIDLVFDRRALRQLLLNLLSNAVKYAGAHGPIAVAADSAADGVKLSVRDQGPGMDRETLAHLFEPFTRGQNVHAGAEGTGLGLALCRKLLDLAGGEIAVTSAPGEGTRIDLTLPYSQEKPASTDRGPAGKTDSDARGDSNAPSTSNTPSAPISAA